MTLKEALKNEVNSALLTFKNHSLDNHFLYSSMHEMEQSMQESGYEPYGVCFNTPFNTHRNKQLAFVYKHEDEVHWCHFPYVLWEYFDRKIKE